MTKPWKKVLFMPLLGALSLLLFAELSVILGLAAYPAMKLWLAVAQRVPATGEVRLLLLGMASAAAYFTFGLALLGVVPVARWLTFALGTPAGAYPYFSMRGWRWASFNALTLLVRFSFINWVRVTPFLSLFHRLMGMNIGARVLINTAVIADQNLIAIGDDTVIGGDVTLVAHVAQRGQLIAAPVTIGRKVTVGIMAVILPGCTIGDGAIIAAGAVLPMNSRVGAGEVWAGVPARCIAAKADPKSVQAQAVEAGADRTGEAEGVGPGLGVGR